MAVDNSAWDGNRAFGQCSTAADYRSICAGERSVGDPDERQHWALPHHYLDRGPNAAGVRAALARFGQTEGLTNGPAARRHLESHMREINPAAASRGDVVRALPDSAEIVRVVGEGDGTPTMVGHFAVFNQWTEISSLYEGHFMEQIDKGAFEKTFKENGPRSRVLFEHGRDPVIGNKVLGKPEVLREDEAGAYAEVPLLNTSYNRDLIPGIEAGQYGQSFRFQVTRMEVNEEPEASDYNPNALPERTIKEVRMMEFGPCTFPAYAGTDVGLRSMTDEIVYGLTLDEIEELRNLVNERESDPDAGSTTTSREDDAGAEQAEEADEATTSSERDAGVDTTSDKEDQTEHETERGKAMSDPNKTLAELEARQVDIRAERETLDADAGTAPLAHDAQITWDALCAEYDENERSIQAKRARITLIEKGRGDGEPGFVPAQFNVSRGPKGDEVYDLSTIRGAFDNPEMAERELCDRAMKAVEMGKFPDLGKRASKEDMQSRVASLLGSVEDKGVLARRILATGHPVYETAFWKALQNRQLTSAESKVMERAALLVGTAGYAVPFALDPTVALISDGVINPMRQVSRVVSIAGDTWKGVSSAGITASFDAEGAEVSEDTPTLTQPSTTTLKASAFVPFSIEAEIWDGLRAEMTAEIQDAKDVLEGQKFTLGTGSPEPQGLIVGATYLATTAGSAALTLADLDTLVDALGPRYQANAILMANRKTYSKVRSLGRATGVTEEWAPEREGFPPVLLGYRRYTNSNIANTPTTTGALIMAVGDFSRFLIVDTIGMNVEYIPHLFHTTSNRPSGSRGLYAYWRTTSLVRDVNAFRVLKVL